MNLLKIKNILSNDTAESGFVKNTTELTIQQYITKMILNFLSIAGISFAVISAIAWIYNIVPVDTFIILSAMSLLFISGLFFHSQGYWQLANIIPPLVVFGSAVYGNYMGGINAPAMLLYVLAIILAASLRGIRDLYIFSLMSLIAFLTTNIAHHYGYIGKIRSGETIFWNRIISASAAFISIILLFRFIIIQFNKALKKNKDEIIERKIIERALRESEKNYRELVQNSNSIILKINSRGEITFCNDFGKNIFGFSNENITGKNIIGTIVPEVDSSGKNLKDMMDKIIANPEIFHFNENENITKDGKRIWVAWANAPVIDSEGNFIEILCIGNDITEKKIALEEKEKIQNQFFHSQKMEAIGTLTSGLSHNFNNILSGIMGSLSLLKINLSNENFSTLDESVRYIDIAMSSSRRASDMIKQLLLLSRKQEIAFTPVDINQSIKNVASICCSSFPKNIIIDVSYASMPMVIMTDEVLIEQMFLNFFVNSLHALTIMNPADKKEGGYIKVSISSVRNIIEENNSNSEHFARIDISDNGIGIDENTRERIFEPFFTTKPKESGTGLGLSMAYGFINRMGGFIRINSEVNQGTTFTILLPEITDKKTSIYSDNISKGLLPGNATILIIDDEEAILSIAEKTLAICGYTVLKAENGIKGISLLKDNPGTVDIVILDISMPFMSGFEVFEKIRNINSEIKIILSSGLADDERLKNALAAGAADFLPKPYTAEDLSQKVNAVANRVN